MSLAGTLEALQADDRVAALDELLRAWRESRAPAVADVVDIVSADVARALPPLEPGRTLKERHQHWIDTCLRGRAADVPRLLDGLAPADAYAPAVQERLEALERRHAGDPRLATKLMAMLCGGFRWNPKPMWTVVFRLLSSLRDTRGQAMLTPHLATMQRAKNGPVFYRDFLARMEKLAVALAQPPALSDGGGVLVERIAELARQFAAGPPPPASAITDHEPAAVAPARGEAELLALVWAAPDDPAPRQVYGDLLAEQGSPRGEYITLAHKPSPTKKDEARMRALLKAHILEWLGPLEPVVLAKTARFEGGFLAACTTRFRTAQQRAELATHPAWSTLREVTTDEPKLVQSARALRRLRDVRPKLLQQLCAGPPLAIESLRLWIDTLIPDKLRDALAGTRAFPRLTDFESAIDERGPIRPDGYAWIFATPLGAQLTRFAVTHNPNAGTSVVLGAWLKVLPRSLASAYFDVGFFDMTLTPSASGFALRVRARLADGGVNLLIHSLDDADPALIDKVEYVSEQAMDRTFQPRLEAALARFAHVERRDTTP